MIELVVLLIKEGNPSRDADATCMVGWLTLLKLLVVQILSGPERLAYCVRPDIGLAWLCQALWKVSSSLTSSPFHQQQHTGTEIGTTRVCLSFVDLIHSLVLLGTDDNIYRIHKVLWSEATQTQVLNCDFANNQQVLSPLACLMGTYHLWSETRRSKKTIEEKYKTMVKQLINPSLLPKIVPPSEGSGFSSDGGNRRKQRLATFLGKPKDFAGTNINNEKENKSSANATTRICNERSSSATSNDSNTSNNPSASTATKRTNESGGDSGNVPASASPGGESITSSLLGSPPVGAERSMVASVARLFSSLYGSNNSGNGGGEEDAANSAQPGEDQELLDIYSDDHDVDEDGDQMCEAENMTDEEEQADVNDENGNGESEEDKEVINTGEGDAGKENDTKDGASRDNDDDDSMDEDNDVDSDDDEEIDSDEGEDCEDCNSMIDMEDDDDDDDDHDDEEDEIMIHEDELPHIEQNLLELQRDFNNQSTNPTSSGGNASSASVYPNEAGGQGAMERSQLYIKAAIEVLAIQHPPISKLKTQPSQQQSRSTYPLTIADEKALMTSIMHIVKPEKKPFDGKVILQRAPTQEEFFRGNLSKLHVSFSMLKSSNSNNNQVEPTIRDLRQYIANDLQMGDSAELMELLVANKILDVDLKLRVILQTVWKDHCIQHSGGSSSTTSLSSLLVRESRGGARSFLSSSSGLSLMLYSSLERSMGSAGSSSRPITEETPIEALPHMVMTYRLTGVDGEATEDTVSTLNDPEAPSESSSPEEIELLMEMKYGITRTVLTGRGVFCLLRSVQSNILHTLQNIRRDGVGASENHARRIFKQSFYPGLSLLVCCAKLPSNRKLLLQARAPTTLLRLLLDVLHALEEDGSDQSSESNSTATALQELITSLASDMSLANGDTSSDDNEESEANEDASTLRLLIQAIETSSLSRTLRNVIAKLVPYLTYGKPTLSEELALKFMAHVDSDQLGEYEIDEGSDRRNSFKPQSVLMDTFIHASISLPANDVCNSLRMELTKCGFVERIARHILRDCPGEPPSWSLSLWSKGREASKQNESVLEKNWKVYSKRTGLKTCFEILIGLCKEHGSTQAFLGDLKEGNVSFLQFCHWLESTSDNTSAGITMKGFGLLAETLLDDIAEFGKPTSREVKMVKSLRKRSRDRKKEIAMDRRKKSLMSMNKFGALSCSSPLAAGCMGNPSNSSASAAAGAPIWTSVMDLFRDSSTTQDATDATEVALSPAAKKRKKPSGKNMGNVAAKAIIVKPEWMKELENMEDETGLTCAVCQEGRKYKSSEMMGLYAYVKKVASTNGDRSSLNGTNVLTNLPPKLPDSLQSNHIVSEWYQSGKAAGDELKDSARSAGALSGSSSRHRTNYYTTTVCAGNAIHINCHAKARQADRNHPKAPKSEWEGAALRNSRVKCNVIFPLVSSRSSSVSLLSVEQTLAEHQTAVANLIGVRPKSNLRTVLHDVRLLLLRISYGEALNADCGGGSLGSNSKLIYYQLSMAKMFESEAQVDAPDTAQHARNLSAGFLAALEIISAEDYDSLGKSSLIRGIADSSLMAALTCILFHNTKDDCGSGADLSEEAPHPKRRWVIGRELFLRGLLNCAGRRHALAIHSSGCVSTRNVGNKKNRSRSFVEWDIENEGGGNNQESPPGTSRTTARASARKSTSPKINSSRASITDFGSAMRPMIVYYAMMEQLSSDFVPDHDDEIIEECANRLVKVIESCQRSKSIHELLEKAKITLSHEEIINELQRGMISA